MEITSVQGFTPGFSQGFGGMKMSAIPPHSSSAAPSSKDKLGVLGENRTTAQATMAFNPPRGIIQASKVTSHLFWLLFPLTVWFSVVNGPIPLILAGGLAGLGGGHGAARGTGAVLALGHVWGLHAGTTAAAAAAGKGALPLAVLVHTQIQSPVFIHLNVHGLKGWKHAQR